VSAGGALALLGALLASPPAAAPAAPAKTAAPARPAGTGTATEFRDGARIQAALTGGVTISPLRLTLASSPALPLPGETVTVTLTVSNAGAVAVTGVLPRLSVTGGTAYAGAFAGPAPAAATIPPNGGQRFAWTTSLAGAGEVRIRAEASGTLAGSATLVRGMAAAALSPPAVAQLTASLSPDPLTVTGGQWFDVVVTVSNTGGVRASRVMPALQAGAGAALVAFQRGPAPAKPVALAPGESRRFTFTYSANGSGTVSFSATVDGAADLAPPGALSRAADAARRAGGAAARAALADARAAAAAAGRWLRPPAPPAGPEQPFLEFESPEDARWETGGYALLEPSVAHATGGNGSLRAAFLVPADLTASPTGAFRPGLRRAAPPRGREPALAPRDWTRFSALRADVWSDADQPVDVRLALADQRGYAWEGLRQLPPRSATTIEFDLAGPAGARLDLARLVSLELSVDTSRLAARPVLYFDRLRFALRPAPAGATVASGSAAASAPTRTVTGIPKR